MLRFRLFLVWLVVAAIPLQGLAAASMLFCGVGTHHASVEIASAHAVGASILGGSHDHSKHSHAGEVQVKKAADNAGKTLPDTSHKCAACASCCHSVAITDFPALVAFAPLPQSDSADPLVLIQPRPSPVPDKPPRA